ncbi:MAG: TonB-dependent receptor plug domain-containing protein [Gammaproteobacteria bacterium]|nr:TonB-dependent receptor plug domain-containing protein [Gammaproteobacteria bacterium]
MRQPLLFFGYAALLSAQAPVASAESAASPFIEEIVVTAQKREESLQETAVSVTAFTGEVIEKLGLRQSVDVTAQTPNFSVGYPNGDTGVPALFIRGVGLNDFGTLNQGPIASYVDESYIASNAAQIFQLLDVDRVEVLRGPQGTLYGRNATGGAVNFISRKPTPEWEGWARAGYGSWETTKFEGAIGGPITDRLGVRAAIIKNDSDGWMQNKLTGNDLNGADELAWRVLLEADPTEAFSVLLNVHGGESKSDSPQYQHLGTTDPESVAVGGADQCTTSQIGSNQCVDFFGYTEQAPYSTPFTGFDVPGVKAYDEGNYDYEPENDTTFWGTSLSASLSIADIEVTSITSYDDIDDSRPEETDASPNDLITGVLAVEQETFSQEIRLAQQLDAWDWIVGGYYMKDEANDHTSFDLLRMLRPLFIGDDVNCTAAPGNPTGFCPEQSVFEQVSDTDQTITSYAMYGDAHFDLTDSSVWRWAFATRTKRLSRTCASTIPKPNSAIRRSLPASNRPTSTTCRDARYSTIRSPTTSWCTVASLRASRPAAFKAPPTAVSPMRKKPSSAMKPDSSRRWQTGASD